MDFLIWVAAVLFFGALSLGVIFGLGALGVLTDDNEVFGGLVGIVLGLFSLAAATWLVEG